MPLNERLLRLAVLKQGEKVLVRQVRPLVELDFDAKKDQFMQEFEQHPVTQEIAEGPDALSRITQLAMAGGNLFSFLGFKRSQKPIDALRTFFDRNIRLGRTRAGRLQGNKVIFNTPIDLPTVAEVDEFAARNSDTRLEWTSRPFTSALSRGVAGFGQYLFNIAKGFPSSRSGPAVQVKGKLRGGSVGPIPYIGPLVANLKRLFASPRSRG